MRTQEQVNEIVRLLLAEYPQADCTLDWRKDYELLFSVRLAAQCTDERVNKITPALFERFPTLEAFAAADVEEVERYVHSCGFYRAKARDIVACANVLLEKYGGELPRTRSRLRWSCGRYFRRSTRPTSAIASCCTAAPCAMRASRTAQSAVCGTCANTSLEKTSSIG